MRRLVSIAWFLALGALGARAQGIVGLNPTPLGIWQWNSTSTQFQPLANTYNLFPLQSNPQPVAFYGWNATLQQWVPCTVGGACFTGAQSVTFEHNGSSAGISQPPTPVDVCDNGSCGQALPANMQQVYAGTDLTGGWNFWTAQTAVNGQLQALVQAPDANQGVYLPFGSCATSQAGGSTTPVQLSCSAANGGSGIIESAKGTFVYHAGTWYMTWSGVTLPSYISASNVTAVYAVVTTGESGTAAPGGYCSWTGSGGNVGMNLSSPNDIQKNTSLSMPGSAITSATCTVELAQSTYGYYGQVAVSMIGLWVEYTGTAPPANTKTLVGPPLVFSALTNTLSISPYYTSYLFPTTAASLPDPMIFSDATYWVSDLTALSGTCTGGGTLQGWCTSNGSAWLANANDVSQILAGKGIAVSPSGGQGAVTVTNTGDGVYCEFNISSAGTYTCPHQLGIQYPLWSCTTISGAACSSDTLTWVSDYSMNLSAASASHVLLALYPSSTPITVGAESAPSYTGGCNYYTGSCTATVAAGQMGTVFCTGSSGTPTLSTTPANTFASTSANGGSAVFYNFGLAGGSTVFACGNATFPNQTVDLYNAGSVYALDTSATNTGSGTTSTSATFSTTGKDLVVFCVATGSSGTLTAGTIGGVSATLRQTTGWVACEDATFTTAQTNITATMTSTQGGTWYGTVAAFSY